MSTLVSGCCMRAPISQLDPCKSSGSMRAVYFCATCRLVRLHRSLSMRAAHKKQRAGKPARRHTHQDIFLVPTISAAARAGRRLAGARTGDMPHVLHVVAVLVAGLLIAGEVVERLALERRLLRAIIAR